MIFKIFALIIGFLVVSYILFIHSSWYDNRFIFVLDYGFESLEVEDIVMSDYSEVMSSEYDQLFIRKLTIENDSIIVQKYRMSFISLSTEIDVDHQVFIYKDGLLQKSLVITGLEERVYFEQYLDSLENDESHEYIFFIAVASSSVEVVLDFEIQIERQYRIFG